MMDLDYLEYEETHKLNKIKKREWWVKEVNVGKGKGKVTNSSLGVARDKSAIVGTHAPTTDEDSGKGKITESVDVVGAVLKPNVENQQLDGTRAIIVRRKSDEIIIHTWALMSVV